MTAGSNPMWVNGSTTAVTMCSARNTKVMRDRFRCRPVVKNRGQLGLWKRSEDKTPSTTTALRSTSETAPAPRVVYQRTVSVIGEGDYEPPETATPELDDELTEVEDDCNPFDVEAVLVEALVVDNGV